MMIDDGTRVIAFVLHQAPAAAGRYARQGGRFKNSKYCNWRSLTTNFVLSSAQGDITDVMCSFACHHQVPQTLNEVL